MVRLRLFSDEDRPLFRQLYIDERLSTTEIAEQLGSSYSTINRYLRAFKISVRSKSEAKKGKKRSEETRKKISASLKGRLLSEETKRKISKSLTGKKREPFTEEHKARLCVVNTGENNPNWIDGRSFESYCPKFNFVKKEEIRNRDYRVCQCCDKSEILNGRRLDVHHIDGDKMQGCNGKRWGLVALCISCNSKPDTAEKEFLIVSNLNILKGE